MYTNNEMMETIKMIQEENLDVRTITMGISLIDCMDTDIDKSCEKIYNKICCMVCWNYMGLVIYT